MSNLYPGFILPVWNWKTPAASIPQQSFGNFRVAKRTVRAGTAWPMCNTLGYDYSIFMTDATLTLLQERVGGKWRDWMVDSPYEWYAMGEYAMRTMPSKVLVGGLGLGLILQHLTLRKDLEKITVIEASNDVIQMTSPYLPNDNRIEIVQGDFFSCVPKYAAEASEFSTVIVDISAGEDHECKEEFKSAIRLLYDYYPDALHLFHSFQKTMDMEIVAQYLGNVEKPIRFVPRRFNRHNE